MLKNNRQKIKSSVINKFHLKKLWKKKPNKLKNLTLLKRNIKYAQISKVFRTLILKKKRTIKKITRMKLKFIKKKNKKKKITKKKLYKKITKKKIYIKIIKKRKKINKKRKKIKLLIFKRINFFKKSSKKNIHKKISLVKLSRKYNKKKLFRKRRIKLNLNKHIPHYKNSYSNMLLKRKYFYKKYIKSKKRFKNYKTKRNFKEIWMKQPKKFKKRKKYKKKTTILLKKRLITIRQITKFITKELYHYKNKFNTIRFKRLKKYLI